MALYGTKQKMLFINIISRIPSSENFCKSAEKKSTKFLLFSEI